MNHMKLVNMPPGWTFSVSCTGAYEITNGEGYVSINFDIRAFAPGMTPVYKHNRKNIYTGLGWRQRLVNDAIACLEGL